LRWIVKMLGARSASAKPSCQQWAQTVSKRQRNGSWAGAQGRFVIAVNRERQKQD